MKNLRLEDQAIMLGSIEQLRKELKQAVDRGEKPDIDLLLRLSTMYSLLDIPTLRKIVVAVDKRGSWRDRRKVS